MKLNQRLLVRIGTPSTGGGSLLEVTVQELSPCGNFAKLIPVNTELASPFWIAVASVSIVSELASMDEIRSKFLEQYGPKQDIIIS